MEDDVTRKIAALVSRQERLTESEASHLMTLFRKRLEHMQPEERQPYPILKFFCNWAMHITLDRSSEGVAILRRINDILVECSGDKTDLIPGKVTEVVSFRQLRRQMRRLIGWLRVEPALVDGQGQWESFVRHLIEIVRDCPLVFGATMARDAQAAYAAVRANPVSNRAWVAGVSLVEVDYGQLGGNSVPGRLLCIHVLLSDTTHIVIPISPSEVFGAE